MKKSSLIILFGFSLILSCVGCDKEASNQGRETSFEIDKLYERGPLTIHLRIDKETITIAETVLLEFEAVIEPAYELQMPQVGMLENFGVIDWDSLDDKLDENNNVVKRHRYRLEPFLSGTFSIPTFTFEFHDANSTEDKQYELSTELIDIEVTSLLGEQRSELVIADIEDVVEMPEKASYWWGWILLLICISILICWFYLRRKKKAELIRIFKPAHELAYEYLRALVKQDLVSAGKIKEFYERISDILRHYIEHRFDLRAPERTTEEFLIELQNTDVLSTSDKDNLGEFLQHCDLVKFARHSPTTQQIQKTFDLVKDFIEKTKSDERKIDVTDKADFEKIVEVGST